MLVSSTKPFPDIETGVIEWLSQTIAELVSSDQANYRYKHVGDELPNGYTKRLPFCAVSVAGGPSNGVTTISRATISVFAKSRSEAWSIISRIFATMGVYPRRFGGVSVDTVQVTVSPTRSPESEPDEDTVCFSGELELFFRR